MKRKSVKAVAIIIIIAMVITSFSFIFFLPKASGAEYAYAATTPQEQKYLNDKMKEFENYLKLIHDNYKDEVEYDTLVNGAFEGAMYSLGDPYSVYFLDSATGQSFVESATGEYEGVGLTLNINFEGLCEVSRVTPNAPADRAGIKSGDVITTIDGKDVTASSLQDISDMLKGKAGTSVTVVVSRGGDEISFTMTREAISAISVYYEMLEGDIGHITLTGFDTGGAKEFKDAEAELIKEGAKSLIVDIRDNPGGLINTAVDIADMLLDQGDVITQFAQRGEIYETVRATKGATEKLPVVLLVNENSASASELLAGALKDNKAATLVGTTTYGKGVSQVFGYTNDGMAFKISINYFLTPNGDEIQGVGVKPDYVVRNSLGEYRDDAAELYKSFAPFAEKTKPVSGDSGLNVFAAQQRLALLGYHPGLSATGLSAVMDDATVAAVKAFQREQGLYPYGTLDFTTMNKLEEVTLAYINNDSKDDLQLEKAVELLRQ